MQILDKVKKAIHSGEFGAIITQRTQDRKPKILLIG